MDIRPEGFSEAGFCTGDLDGWRGFLKEIGGYREIWRGPIPEAILRHWSLEPRARNQ